MKKKLLLIILTIMLAVCGMALTACNSESQNNGNNTDETNTIQNGIQFNTLTLNADNTVYGKVANGTTTFSFLDEVTTKGKATYGVYLDMICSQEVKSKTVPLEEGNNYFYIFAENTDEGEILYNIQIRVIPIYTVKFDMKDDYLGSWIVETQFIEENKYATIPLKEPTRLGYDFKGWDFDFNNKITKNLTINAIWGKKPEMMNFSFKTMGENMCHIVGIIDKKINKIIVPNYVTQMDEGLLSESIIEEASVPANIMSAIPTTNLISLTISGGTTIEADVLFQNCNKLKKIVISNTITKIESYAFYGCNNLEEVQYLGTVNQWVMIEFSGSYSTPLHFADKLFINGEEVKEIDIESATFINEYSFVCFDGLTKIKVGNNVKSIGEDAFYGCVNLSNVVLGKNVEKIGEDAFYNCTKLEKVYYEDTKEKWALINIGSNTKLVSANRFYYSETEPQTSGNYWHYVDGVVTEW